MIVGIYHDKHKFSLIEGIHLILIVSKVCARESQHLVSHDIVYKNINARQKVYIFQGLFVKVNVICVFFHLSFSFLTITMLVNHVV